MKTFVYYDNLVNTRMVYTSTDLYYIIYCLRVAPNAWNRNVNNFQMVSKTENDREHLYFLKMVY
jgi:hypothetical protein